MGKATMGEGSNLFFINNWAYLCKLADHLIAVRQT